MQAGIIDKSKIKSPERNEPTYDIILTKRTRLKAFQSVKKTQVDETHIGRSFSIDHNIEVPCRPFSSSMVSSIFIFVIVLQISEALGVAGRFQSNGINILYCTNNCKVQWQERILYFKVAMDTEIDTNEARNIL